MTNFTVTPCNICLIYSNTQMFMSTTRIKHTGEPRSSHSRRCACVDYRFKKKSNGNGLRDRERWGDLRLLLKSSVPPCLISALILNTFYVGPRCFFVISKISFDEITADRNVKMNEITERSACLGNTVYISRVKKKTFQV